MSVKAKKTGWAKKMALKAKLMAPTGIRLTPSETIALAEVYKDDAKKISKNYDEVETALQATSTLDIEESIYDAQSAKSLATGTFKRTKDPIKRREWARRVVVADTTLHSMCEMRKRMSATKDRLTMIKGDLELQLMEAEAKAQEAEAYAKAGKQLRLVGQKLVDARTRAKTMKVEYSNLEITMEGAEKKISNLHPDEVINKALKISRKER